MGMADGTAEGGRWGGSLPSMGRRKRAACDGTERLRSNCCLRRSAANHAHTSRHHVNTSPRQRHHYMQYTSSAHLLLHYTTLCDVVTHDRCCQVSTNKYSVQILCANFMYMKKELNVTCTFPVHTYIHVILVYVQIIKQGQNQDQGHRRGHDPIKVKAQLTKTYMYEER